MIWTILMTILPITDFSVVAQINNPAPVEVHLVAGLEHVSFVFEVLSCEVFVRAGWGEEVIAELAGYYQH